MKISTRSRYGIRALLDLASSSDSQPVQLKDIARRQGISLHYLEHIIAPLSGSGMIRSIRGARGGILLVKPPLEIKISEVVRLLEGSIALVECVNDPESCPRCNACAVRELWVEMKTAMDSVLEGTTLQDLVTRQKQMEADDKVMYYI